MLMASPSSIYDSLDAGRMIDREITPIGEASSSEYTESLYDKGENMEGTYVEEDLNMLR